MSPPPIASPPLLLHEKQSLGTSNTAVVDDGNWIVAYGYTCLEEHDELLEILSGYGLISERQSNGNWLAIRYKNSLSAEKSLCCQPIRLSNSPSLCGTVRASRQLLQGLRAQPPRTTSSEASSIVRNYEYPASTGIDPQRQMPLQEDDILANYEEEGQHKRMSTSVCDRLFDWYFGWGDQRGSHPHSD